jgi:hypothetical protein
MRPQNFPETLVWYSIIGTYPIYLLGAQPICSTGLATVLIGYLIWKTTLPTEATPVPGRTVPERIQISLVAVVWLIATVVIGLTVFVNAFSLEASRFDLVKSFLIWYTTWGLMALFPLAGHLPIRPQLIYRASCILGLQSLIVIAIGVLGDLAGIANVGYTSPLNIWLKLAGGAPEQFQVDLLHSPTTRLRLFAVWPTFLALLGNIHFWLARQEPDPRWRWIGLFTSVLMVLASRSRTATLCLICVPVLLWFLTHILRPWVQFGLAILCCLGGMFAPIWLDGLTLLRDLFDRTRAGSSAVRATLYRLTINRWWNDAPIWGTGTRDRGPDLVNHLPLGSHQTWLGTLFSHGIVGLSVLVLAFLWAFIDLFIKAQTSQLGRVGLSIFLVLVICSFADNLEFMSYLIYPGLLVLGAAFQESYATAPLPTRISSDRFSLNPPNQSSE